MAIFNVISDNKVCIAPRNLRITDITNSGFRIVWDQVGPATTYEVEVLSISGAVGSGPLTIDTDCITIDNSTIRIDSTLTDCVRTINTELTVTGLQSQTEYGVRVKSLCGLTEESLYTIVTTAFTEEFFDFRASNNTIRTSNNNLRVSELQISNSEI